MGCEGYLLDFTHSIPVQSTEQKINMVVNSVFSNSSASCMDKSTMGQLSVARGTNIFC